MKTFIKLATGKNNSSEYFHFVPFLLIRSFAHSLAFVLFVPIEWRTKTIFLAHFIVVVVPLYGMLFLWLNFWWILVVDDVAHRHTLLNRHPFENILIYWFARDAENQCRIGGFCHRAPKSMLTSQQFKKFLTRKTIDKLCICYMGSIAPQCRAHKNQKLPEPMRNVYVRELHSNWNSRGMEP